MRVTTLLVALACPSLLTVPLIGCGSAVDPNVQLHTYVVQLAVPPSEVHSNFLEVAGVSEWERFEVLSAVAFLAAPPAERFDAMPDAEGVYDLGTEANPTIDLFVTLVSDVTDSDVQFVRSMGGVTHGATPILPRVLPVLLPLSAVDELGTWERVERLSIATGGTLGA